MAGIVTKWQVLQEHAVYAGDQDADGSILDSVVEEWVAAARDAYLARCPRLQEFCAASGLEVAHRAPGLREGARLGSPTGVVVSASATEVRPESFTLAIRIRPVGGDHEAPIDVVSVIRLVRTATGEVHPVIDDIRDELIALEHSAAHFN